MVKKVNDVQCDLSRWHRFFIGKNHNNLIWFNYCTVHRYCTAAFQPLKSSFCWRRKNYRFIVKTYVMWRYWADGKLLLLKKELQELSEYYVDIIKLKVAIHKRCAQKQELPVSLTVLIQARLLGIGWNTVRKIIADKS